MRRPRPSRAVAPPPMPGGEGEEASPEGRRGQGHGARQRVPPRRPVRHRGGLAPTARASRPSPTPSRSRRPSAGGSPAPARAPGPGSVACAGNAMLGSCAAPRRPSSWRWTARARRAGGRSTFCAARRAEPGRRGALAIDDKTGRHGLRDPRASCTESTCSRPNAMPMRCCSQGFDEVELRFVRV